MNSLSEGLLKWINRDFAVNVDEYVRRGGPKLCDEARQLLDTIMSQDEIRDLQDSPPRIARKLSRLIDIINYRDGDANQSSTFFRLVTSARRQIVAVEVPNEHPRLLLGSTDGAWSEDGHVWRLTGGS